MYFALSTSKGDTVTTAASPDGSPRTSAVPAPSVFLPDDEPSTSRAAVGTSTDAPSTSRGAVGTSTDAPSTSRGAVGTSTDAPSTSRGAVGTSTDAPSTSRGAVGTSTDAPTEPITDGRISHVQHGGSDSDVGEPQITLQDFDMSSEDESQRTGSWYNLSMGDYIFKRNLINEASSAKQVNKAVVEYVNLKFVENNFRSMGLDYVFDKNDITIAAREFESFEIWYSHVKEYTVDKKYIRDLRLPLFCHLYLNLYSQRNHVHLQLFLKTFEYIFSSSRGAVYLQELRNVTDVLNLSPRLDYLRQNKFLCAVSPVFISNLYDFFNLNTMLKAVFQEWFDINYHAYNDPKILFDECYTNNLVRVNNLDIAYAPKQNNNVIATKTTLFKKTLNSSESNNKRNNNSENNFYNNQRASTSKDYFVGHQNSSSSYQESNTSNDQYSELANSSDEDLQEEVTNSEEDESVENSDQSFENSEQSVEMSEQSNEYSEQSIENSEQSIDSSEQSIENSEQSSSEDHCFEPRSNKKNDERKHKKHNRDSSSSYEQESRRIKKLRAEKDDDTSLQNRSRSQENAKFCEESLREGQNSTEQKEVKEKRIILRIARMSNRFSVIVSNTMKESNDPENPLPEKSNEEQISNEWKKSRKHRKKHKSRSKRKSTTDNNIRLHDSSTEMSSDEEQVRKKKKSSSRKKSKNSQISDDEEKKYARQKKSGGCTCRDYDYNMETSESLSEISDNEEKKYEQQKKCGSNKSTNDDNAMQISESLSEISNDEEKDQKQQKKSGKSKSDISNDEKKSQKQQKKQKLRGKPKFDHTIDGSHLCGSSHKVSKEEEKTNKDKDNHKSNDKGIYDNIDDNSNLSESSSKDSSKKYSSLYSSFDEEYEMRKYIRNKKKSAQNSSYKYSCRMKYTKITKIDLQNFDDDLYLGSTRRIILKSCNKLACSILTSDQKTIVAGSLDSLIYLWERADESVLKQTGDVLHNIGNINHSNFTSSVQENNLFEYFDKSDAFVLRGHGGPIFDLAELPSAKILLSASNDKTYRAWDIVSKCCLEVYNEYEHRTWCIAACPISLQVATGSCDGTSCLWFMNYKHPLRIFAGHLDDILVIKFHPNQVLLATGSSDKTIRVFEISTGECHRLLVGHTDYITCLEFYAQKPNCLASASVSGEIIIWDLPSSEMVWKIRVGNVSFSNLVWLNNDVLLASITSGVVLKCDTTLNYIDSSCKVKGFETTFDRLMSLQMIDNIVYTIGIPDKLGCLKPILKIHKEKASQMKNELEKSHKKTSALSKLFFPQHIFDNSSNLEILIRGFKSPTLNHNHEFEYQLNTNQEFKKSLSQHFLNMNLRSAPFNLTTDEISKLSSEYQSDNLPLTPAVSITNNLHNAYLLPIQQNVQTTNQNSTNVQLPSTSKSHKINKKHGPLKSKITGKPHNFGNSSLTMHTSIQHMQIKTTTIQEQLHIEDCRETNMLVKQNLHTTSTSINKQQISNILQVTRPGTSQLLQNITVQQEHQIHLQPCVGSNSNVAVTSIQQQQLFQQSRSNTNLAKGNIQQRLSPQTNIRSSNTNVTQRLSPKQSHNKSSG